MRDERGLYYHAQAGNPRERVYVRKAQDGEVEFRLWNMDKPEIWENHPWVGISAIQEAAAIFASQYEKGKDKRLNPLELYDLNIARTLLREADY